ncbi:hypothetical protein IIB50_02480, partial [Patescibacteria group bacterium]|nr:hypothetical protein [Patescibacteria group bacterium]
ITIVLTPLWLPAILFAVFWHLWLNYIRSEAIKNDTYTLLEIRLPREISKSPLAMETVLSGMHIGIGETTFIDRYWAGKTRPWFSLEIVSIEGEIHFFIWTRTFLKELIESQIYAQYPTVEIYEVEDYALPIALDLEKTNLWGCDFKLSEPDPIPIKTYIDYGLDKDPKEEFKINPLASQLEFFGSIGKGEQLWMQIIIRVNRNEKHKAGTLFGKKGWKDEAQEEIDKIIKAATFKTEDIKMPTVLNLSKGQAENVAAIERSISKLGYDCGIRGIYFADKDKFNPKNIVGLVHVMKQYSSNTLNKFGPARWMIPFNYPWQDFRGKRQNRARHQLLEAYKRRSYFHPPFKTQPFVLSTEELATLFHFPGEVVQTPTLSRVPSTKSEAPSNLPT